MATLRVHGAVLASKPTLRVHGAGLTGSTVATPKLRVYGAGATGPARVTLLPLADITAEPQEPVVITVSLTPDSSTPDTYQWRVVSGTAVPLVGHDATMTFESPSAMPPLGATTVIGVVAVLGSFTSSEVTLTLTTLPQLTWSRVHGGQWVGAKPRVTVG